MAGVVGDVFFERVRVLFVVLQDSFSNFVQQRLHKVLKLIEHSLFWEYVWLEVPAYDCGQVVNRTPSERGHLDFKSTNLVDSLDVISTTVCDMTGAKLNVVVVEASGGTVPVPF